MKTALLVLAAVITWAAIGYFLHGVVPYHDRNTFKWIGIVITVASQIFLMLDRSTKIWLTGMAVGASLFIWFSPHTD